MKKYLASLGVKYMRSNMLFNLVMISAAVSACSGDPPLAEQSAPIISGTPVSTDTLGTAEVTYSDGSTGWGCSGTVINGNWLLTAHHCVTVGEATTGGTAVNPANISASVLNGSSTTGIAIFRHPTLDVALVELAGPLLNPKTGTPFPAVLYTGKAAKLVGQTFFCEGWGYNTFTGTYGVLRSANLEISQMDGSSYRIVPNGSGQIDWLGDSGSSCFSGSQLLGVQSTCGYSGSTVDFCDQVAIENFYDWATPIMSARTFQATDLNDAVVLGSNGNLWYESAPFGNPPPPRIQIDGNALTFQRLGGLSVYQDVFVLGSDGNLWRESATGAVPPPRTQVDANVRSFQAIDSSHVVVLGDDTNLWLETGPFGQVPPSRIQIDGSVRSYQALDEGHVLVLGSDGNLWLEYPNGSVPPPRIQVDGNVGSFQALGTSTVFVLGTNGNLWLESPNGSVPPPRVQVDGSVAAFQVFDAGDVVVLGLNGDLWFEHGPFGNVPPSRQLIDGNVRP